MKDDLNDLNSRIAQLQQGHNEELATRLLRQFEAMVKMSAHKLSYNRNELFEDLFQVGQMSLYQSLRQFDPAKGVPFEAYAMKSMIGHMKNYLRDKSWYIQVPRRIKEKGAKVQKTIEAMTGRLGRSPNIKEIAAELDLTEQETVEILAGRDYYRPVSLDVPVKDEEGTTLRGDLIAAANDDFRHLEDRLVLEEAMQALDEVERQVLELLFQQGLSQRQVASRLAISQMSVSRMQKRAVQKLKDRLK
ncbi:RNA polymerase subunit sigma-70 [Xylanibacillus composti]|uniref:RNA polymerase sigma factor SigB n=1 Tax=Xylanibacillus composti TaxID=1572762 RepID=A0A8J4M2S9_9BACL|nr:sigma-70 family RNA polymerase sigma factor [Xylanibacillus composti]MDT9725798.1 RNA polymerase subunit sigma-70 [Xylanibacillus composti]GIQ69247.1 RNA polymerase sigma factor SigB [Xylanibacillus composti]